MASRYTPVPAPSLGNRQNTPHGHVSNDYELSTDYGSERERYEPFASIPSSRVSSVEDTGYAYYHGETPMDPAPKTATASAISLTSQHNYSSKSFSSGESKPEVRSTVKSWMPELFAVMVSVGSLLAIVAVLRREDGRLISTWNLAVPLNAVIATLGTLARTTLAFALSACIGQQKWNWLRLRSDHLVAWTRFDEASRGPWGATRLFFWLRLR